MTPFEITVTTLSVLTFAVGFGPRLLALAAGRAKATSRGEAAKIGEATIDVRIDAQRAPAFVTLPEPIDCRAYLVAIRAKSAQVTDVELRTEALAACDTLTALFDPQSTKATPKTAAKPAAE